MSKRHPIRYSSPSEFSLLISASSSGTGTQFTIEDQSNIQIPCQGHKVLQVTSVQRKLQKHHHLPLLLPKEKVRFFSLLQMQAGNELCSLALAKNAFAEDNARVSQELEQERMKFLLNTLQEHTTECLFLGHLLFMEP